MLRVLYLSFEIPLSPHSVFSAAVAAAAAAEYLFFFSIT